MHKEVLEHVVEVCIRLAAADRASETQCDVEGMSLQDAGSKDDKAGEGDECGIAL